MNAGPLVVVGDALLDRDVEGRADRLAPDAPAPVLDETAARTRPGGAALAAALAASDGGEVVLVTALGPGPAGEDLRRLLGSAGVHVVDLGLAGPTPEKTRYRSGGRSLLRVDRGGAPLAGPPQETLARVAAALSNAGAVLVSDYGRGVAALPELRSGVAATPAPVVWDPHRRGPAPVPGAMLVTPNHSEIAGVAGPAAAGGGLADLNAAASAVRREWRAQAVAVTRGAQGALVVAGEGSPLAVPARALAAGLDPCGAGDRFAATAAAALGAGALVPEAVVAAVCAATDFVDAGGAGSWREPRPDRTSAAVVAPQGGAGNGPVASRIAAARRRGATVVATGGCFDLLHAGHLHLLRAARALGDHLVVCVNSDSSVRRLKGSERPVVGEADRVAMLAALEFVDDVVCFDDDDPCAVLRRLRPDVFVKGGDYTGRDLVEAQVVAGWGGQAVTVPYLSGRSTTGILSQLGAGGT